MGSNTTSLTTERAAAVLTKATLRAAALLGLSDASLATAVGLSEADISRMSSTNEVFEPATKPAELAALVVRVYRSLNVLVGDNDEHRHAWMASYNDALCAVPGNAIRTAEGLVRMVMYLEGPSSLA